MAKRGSRKPEQASTRPPAEPRSSWPAKDTRTPARRRIPKAKKQRSKRVSYQLIKRDSVAGKGIYRMLDQLVEAHHSELLKARILVAWNMAWKADVDGRVTLGKCRKASDLDRELAPFDFVILLRKEFFEDAAVTEAQRLALIDHELSHATVRLDANTGEPVIDERGRTVYRLVKHDIEEFSAVVARHGLYKRDLEHFFHVAKVRQRELPLEPAAKVASGKPGNGGGGAHAFSVDDPKPAINAALARATRIEAGRDGAPA